MKQEKYKVGDIVYVKPNDSKVLKGVIVSFQAVGDKLPIVECDHPYKKGEKFQSAFGLERISKSKIIKIVEWGLVERKYKYQEEL